MMIAAEHSTRYLATNAVLRSIRAIRKGKKEYCETQPRIKAAALIKQN